MKSMHRARGFTLIEILVALAVFAVMAAIAYGGLWSVISSRTSVDAALDRSKHLQMALWRLQQDLDQTVNRPIRGRYGDPQPAVLGGPEIGLSVTRAGWPNPLGEPRGTLQRVHYALNAKGELIRSYFRVLDRAPDSKPVQTDILGHVTAVRWRFLADDGQWQDSWPPGYDAGAYTPNTDTASAGAGNGSREPLPVAIELTLKTTTWGRLRLLYMIPGSRL